MCPGAGGYDSICVISEKGVEEIEKAIMEMEMEVKLDVI